MGLIRNKLFCLFGNYDTRDDFKCMGEIVFLKYLSKINVKSLKLQ